MSTSDQRHEQQRGKRGHTRETGVPISLLTKTINDLSESDMTIPAAHLVGVDDPAGQYEPVPKQRATLNMQFLTYSWNKVNTRVIFYKLYLRDIESLKMILLDSTNLQTKLWTNKGRRTILFLMNVLDALA